MSLLVAFEIIIYRKSLLAKISFEWKIEKQYNRTHFL